MKRSTWSLLLLLVAIAACAPRPRGVDSRTNEPRRAGGTSVQYTVAPDDTWASISESFFGRADRADRLATQNGREPGSAPEVGRRIEVRVEEKELDLVRAIAEARGPYNSGVEALARDDVEAAREAFERAVDRAPHFVDARYNLGLALMRDGELRAARRELQKVERDRPDDRDVLYALAATWFHEEEYEQALAPLQAALRVDPDFLRARYTLALSLERLGEAALAREQWEAYLRRDSSSAWADEARQHLQSSRTGS